MDDSTRTVTENAPGEDAAAAVDRRAVVTAGAAVGLGLLAAACSSGGTPPAAAPASAAPTSEGPAPTTGESPASTSAEPTTTTRAAAPRGVSLGKASAIPVGGGVIFAAQRVVVTHPTAGTYVALSAICTHQGCTVSTVSGGTINCPCHGSRFHLDGTVARGPATRSLARRSVTVQSGELRLG